MTRELGVSGEKLALEKITSQGYKVIDKNFTCKIGEIDIIAKDKDTLVFIEVRTKSNGKFGLPQETVNNRKQQKIRRVAEYYLLKNNLHGLNCRFDVVGILWRNGVGVESQVEIIKDAF